MLMGVVFAVDFVMPRGCGYCVAGDVVVNRLPSLGDRFVVLSHPILDMPHLEDAIQVAHFTATGHPVGKSSWGDFNREVGLGGIE